MNLTKLFETQRILDARIEIEHPRDDSEDRLTKKILALLAELAECANEWRGFKFWSTDQKPRLKATKQGMTKSGAPARHLVEYNPLLEEYVDCLHFFLSIGLESRITPMRVDIYPKAVLIDDQFTGVFASIGDMSRCLTTHNYCQSLEKFIGLGEMLGFTWKQIEEAYYDKNAINHNRQDTGY